MQACDLVEFAAILASNGSAIVGHAAHFSSSGLEQYWTAARCRHERWCRDLKQFSQELHSVRAHDLTERWRQMGQIIEEILTTEILTRVWGAICCASERHRGLDEASSLVRNILTAHLEARHRALNLMVYGHGLRVEEAVLLNRMRRRNERWNDVLLSQLSAVADVSEFAFSASRVRDFAGEVRTSRDRATAWSLLLAALRVAYQYPAPAESPNADVNSRVAAGILGCLPRELFESTGMLKSMWLWRIQHAASDTQGLIEQLIQLDAAPSSDLPDQLRRPGLPRTRGPL